MSPLILTKSTSAPGRITRFTNCRLVQRDRIVETDLFVSADTGKIVQSQDAFYSHHAVPEQVIDCGGQIVAPGFIDVQLNGAMGFDFSVPLDDMSTYGKKLKLVNRGLISTGVTSYLPTLTSQRSEVYEKTLSYLGPSGAQRNPQDGAESLGAHCEGPFLSPTKNGIHNPEVLLGAPRGYEDLEACYGAQHLQVLPFQPSPIKMITAAPEIGRLTSAIPRIVDRDIIFSIGHSEATFEEASKAVQAGATMITHLFNAMRPLHHRNPGIFGVLGQNESRSSKPFFGVIADGEHLHPTTVKIAYNAFPQGCILVTDAMRLVGLPDGLYDWTNGDRIVKKGSLLTLEGTDKIAGSAVTILECLSNFINYTGVSLVEAIRTVTYTPAKLLGLQKVKGCLDPGSDADLCILSEERDGDEKTKLVLNQVWKFGVKVFDEAAFKLK